MMNYQMKGVLKSQTTGGMPVRPVTGMKASGKMDPMKGGMMRGKANSSVKVFASMGKSNVQMKKPAMGKMMAGMTMPNVVGGLISSSPKFKVQTGYMKTR